jgi:hypothetical protein
VSKAAQEIAKVVNELVGNNKQTESMGSPASR